MRFRTAALVITSLVVADTLPAQEPPRPRRVGFVYGQSISDVTDVNVGSVLFVSDDVRKETRSGRQFGVFINLPIGRVFSLQPEAHYVRKGITFRLRGTGGFAGEEPEPLTADALFGLKLSYLDVPLLARFDFPRDEQKWRPFLVAGPMFSLRASCQYELEVLPTDVNWQCDETRASDFNGPLETDPIRKFEYGMVAGGGIAFRFFGVPMLAQARYGRSLSPVAIESAGADGKNAVISLLFGMAF